MKKIFLLIFLLNITLVLAQCPDNLVDCSNKELNQLSNEELNNAISQNTITLMNDYKIFSEINNRAKKDLNIFNYNKNLQKEWFKKFGINDEGAKIESYDGINIKTKGTGSTTFNIHNHKGATVLKDGTLILKQGIKISSGKVKKEQKGISVEGGVIDLSNSKDLKVTIENGEVLINDKKYLLSGKEVEFLIEKGIIKFQGENIIIEKEGRKIAEINGKINIYPDKHLDLENGVYSAFEDNQKIYDVETDKKIGIFRNNEEVIQTQAYIKENQGILKIENINGENIKIIDYKMKRVDIGKIEKGSIKLKNENKDSYLFEKGSVSAKGNIINLPEATYINEKGEIHKYNFKDSEDSISIEKNDKPIGIVSKSPILSKQEISKEQKTSKLNLNEIKIMDAYSETGKEIFVTENGEVIMVGKELAKVYYKKPGGEIMLIKSDGSLEPINPWTSEEYIINRESAYGKNERPWIGTSKLEPNMEKILNKLYPMRGITFKGDVVEEVIENDGDATTGPQPAWYSEEEKPEEKKTTEIPPPERKGPYNINDVTFKQIGQEVGWFFKYIKWKIVDEGKTDKEEKPESDFGKDFGR